MVLRSLGGEGGVNFLEWSQSILLLCLLAERVVKRVRSCKRGRIIIADLGVNITSRWWM